MHIKLTSTVLHLMGAVLVASMIACGGPKTGKSDNSDEASKEKDAANAQLACGEAPVSENTTFRVLGSDGLSNHFSATFGPGAVLDQKGSYENLVQRYQTQLGGASGKKIGGLTADEVGPGNPLTSYFAVVGIVAANAGLFCTTSDDERCKCDDNESAAAMLNRAVSFKNFCPDEAIVKDFAAFCKAKKSDAITALGSSFAFVKK